MTSHLKLLRKQQCDAYKQKLGELLEWKLFKEFAQDLRLDLKYEFKQIDSSYQKQLIDAASYAFSICGKSAEAILFQLSANDLYTSWKLRFDHLTNTGTYLMAIDKKTNTIVGGVGFVDLCDYGINYPLNGNNNEYPSNVRDLDSAVTYAYSIFADKNKEFKELWNVRYDENNMDKYRLYGKYCFPGLWFSTPDARNSGLSLFTRYLNEAILYQLGYRYLCTDVANRVSMKFAFKAGEQLMGTVLLKEFDRINMEKYINDLKYKYKYNDRQIKKLENLSIFIVVADYEYKYKDKKIYEHIAHLFDGYKKYREKKK
eukprot:359125_1